jgi:hypothetical protein
LAGRPNRPVRNKFYEVINFVPIATEEVMPNLGNLSPNGIRNFIYRAFEMVMPQSRAEVPEWLVALVI